MKRPKLYEVPITDSKSYEGLDFRKSINWEKYAKDLDAYINSIITLKIPHSDIREVAKKYGDALNKSSDIKNIWHELDFTNGAIWYKQKTEKDSD